MREEIMEEEIQTDSTNSRKATGWMKRMIGVLMVLVMAVSVAAPAAVAGSVGRNAVAAAAVPVNLYSTAVSATVFGILGAESMVLTPLTVFAAIPFPGHIRLAASPIVIEGGTEAILAASELVRLSSLAPIVHATIWNGIDLALLNKTAFDAIAAPIEVGAALYAIVALGTVAATVPVATVSALAFNGAIGAAAVGTALGAAALGTAALAAPAVLGAGALGAGALGAAALGTTALGAGALGAATLGAGALATTAAVGTAAAVGAGIIGYNLLNSSNNESNENEQTDPNASNENTETPENSEETPAGETVQA